MYPEYSGYHSTSGHSEREFCILQKTFLSSPPLGERPASFSREKIRHVSLGKQDEMHCKQQYYHPCHCPPIANFNRSFTVRINHLCTPPPSPPTWLHFQRKHSGFLASKSPRVTNWIFSYTYVVDDSFWTQRQLPQKSSILLFTILASSQVSRVISLIFHSKGNACRKKM